MPVTGLLRRIRPAQAVPSDIGAPGVWTSQGHTIAPVWQPSVVHRGVTVKRAVLGGLNLDERGGPVFIGFHRKPHLLATIRSICAGCQGRVTQELFSVRTRLRLFFVPIMPLP